MTMPSADQFLMSGGGHSAKFPTIGTTVTGVISTPPEVQQQRDPKDGKPKFWDDGKPMLQLKVALSTFERDPADPDDDGTRNLYVKGQMQQAIKDAVKAAGAGRLDVGGTLTVTYIADGEKKNVTFNAPKVYAAVYAPPNPLDVIADPTPPRAQQAAPAPAVNMAAILAQVQAAQTPAAPAMPACPPGLDPAGWPAMWQAMSVDQQATLLAALGHTT